MGPFLAGQTGRRPSQREPGVGVLAGGRAWAGPELANLDATGTILIVGLVTGAYVYLL